MEKCICKGARSPLKAFDLDFVKFWHPYFCLTDKTIRELAIKEFFSAEDLIKLIELGCCKCDDLIDRLCKLHEIEKKEKVITMEKFRYSCLFCDKQIKAKNRFKVHLQSHTREWFCEPCNQVIRRCDIDRHNKTRKHLENSAKKAK